MPDAAESGWRACAGVPMRAGQFSCTFVRYRRRATIVPHGADWLLPQETGRIREQSWIGMLLDLKSRGLTISPTLAAGDGALGCLLRLILN
jgi:hypothetical protein